MTMNNVSLRIKLFYFVNYLGVGFHPFLALYLYRRNFLGWQIGLVLGSMPIAIMISQPIWSYLSDVLHTRKWILLISCIGISISTIGIGLSHNFVSVLICGIVMATMQAPVTPISTALALDHLEKTNKPQEYSLLRLWGSLSFSISSLLFATFLLGNFLSLYTWIMGGVYLILGFISLLLPDTVRPYSYKVLEVFRLLPSNPNFVIYLIGSVFIGASFSISNSYMTVFMSSLAASSLLVGIAISLQGLLEIPLMLFVPKVSKRISWSKLILFGALVLPVRWFLFLIIKDPAWILPVQLLHSIATVSFMVVGVSFIDKRISNKWRATGQGLYATAMGGIGSGIGLYFAGMIMEKFSIRSIWGLNLILGFIGVLFIGIALRRYKNPRKAEE